MFIGGVWFLLHQNFPCRAVGSSDDVEAMTESLLSAAADVIDFGSYTLQCVSRTDARLDVFRTGYIAAVHQELAPYEVVLVLLDRVVGHNQSYFRLVDASECVVCRLGYIQGIAVNDCYLVAVCKGIAVDALHVLVNGDSCEVCASREGVLEDFCHVGWDDEVGNLLSVERQLVSQGERLCCAALESDSAPCREVGDVERLQARTLVEGSIADVG